MAKYDQQFKQRLVKAYLRGEAGCKALSARHGIHYALLERWVAAYREHGAAGLRRKYGDYDARFKMQVLQRMRDEDLPVRQIMALFDIRSPGSIAKWSRLYDEGGIDALAPRPRGRPRKMTITQPDKPTEDKTSDTRTREDLLKENEYLRAEVAYLKKLDALLQAKKQAAQKKKRK